MRLVYQDTVTARDLGMSGKWVGHPAQLFAVLLAFEAGQSDASLEAEAQKLEAYQAALDADLGATMIDGVMSDRATDRHARVVLRRATATGRFPAARAHALALISDDELREMTP
jgi:citrate lyase beta subunit